MDAGRRAAEAIHLEITGRPASQPTDGRLNFTKGKRFEDVDMRNFDGYSIRPRESMPVRPPDRHFGDFNEVELGFTMEMARREAKRCLQCGCLGLAKCSFRQLALEHKVNATVSPNRRPAAVDQSHPFISIDANRCVGCHRCQR